MSANCFDSNAFKTLFGINKVRESQKLSYISRKSELFLQLEYPNFSERIIT